jgi:hypothetical protein
VIVLDVLNHAIARTYIGVALLPRCSGATEIGIAARRLHDDRLRVRVGRDAECEEWCRNAAIRSRRRRCAPLPGKVGWRRKPFPEFRPREPCARTTRPRTRREGTAAPLTPPLTSVITDQLQV